MSERGPDSLTVSAVAHAAGLNRTTAYQHFRTRDELVTAVVEELADEISGALAEPLAIGDHVDHLAAFFLEKPEVTRLALHHVLSENPLPRESRDAYVAGLTELTGSDRAQDGVDTEMLAYVLLSVCVLWPVLARMDYEDEQDQRMATKRFTRELKRLLLYGVLRPAAWPELASEVVDGRTEEKTHRSGGERP
jgi:AcrR family transcriptional regulator